MQYQKTKASISGIATGTDENKAGSKNNLLSRASFKLVKGKLYNGQLPITSFLTDDKGHFHLDLPVGVYAIVEGDRPEVFTLKENTATEKWDNECRKKQWETPLFVLTIKSMADSSIQINQHLPIKDPCLKN